MKSYLFNRNSVACEIACHNSNEAESLADQLEAQLLGEITMKKVSIEPTDVLAFIEEFNGIQLSRSTNEHVEAMISEASKIVIEVDMIKD